MAGAIPVIDETLGSPTGPMLANVAGLPQLDAPPIAPTYEHVIENRAARRLSIYKADAGNYLVDELVHLSRRAVEPNLFFNARFLAPAMQRLEDKDIRFAVIRDFKDETSRTRLLFPYSVERPGLQFGPSIIRSWSTNYGPLGTPLVDSDDPASVVEDLFDLMGRRHLGLPQVLVLPDMRTDGAVTQLFKSVAMGRNLSVHVHEPHQRPVMRSLQDGDTYLASAIGGHHWRDLRRLRRKLESVGAVEYVIARNQSDILTAVEHFLSLEATGWKGRGGTAMAIDRFRAAFAREAIFQLAAEDRVRIHMLKLDGRPVAVMVVFIEAGIAYTWKTAYDETLSRFSPGNLLLVEIVRNHLDDPNILETDSCAIPDHPVMTRFFSERMDMETLVIGLTPAADRAARQVAMTMHLYRQTRHFAKRMRRSLGTILGAVR